MTLTATAPDLVAIADWLDALSADARYADPWIGGLTTVVQVDGSSVMQFTMSMTVTDQNLVDRRRVGAGMIRTRKDLVSVLVMGVLVLFAAYYFLIRPQRAELAAVGSDLRSTQQNVDDARHALLATDSPDGQPGTDGAQLDLAVPVDPRLAELLRQIDGLVTASGVTVAAISPMPLGANPNGPGGSVQISIDAAGSTTAVRTFLQGLRDLPRLVVIEQIGLVVQSVAPTDHVQIVARVFARQTPTVVES